MSLTGRFSTFFLVALALVLIAFSTTLFVSGRIYLERELEDRMLASLAVLAAAAEVHPEGVEWEPQERVLPLGQDSGDERMRWIVFDDRGRRVDRSKNLADVDPTDRWMPQPGTSALPSGLVDGRGRRWRVMQRRVEPGGVRASGDVSGPGPKEVFYPSLTATVFALRSPMEATLRHLGWFLAAVAVVVWLLSGLLCRRISRRALAPLTRMVESARGLDASDPGWSLIEAGTGDELDDLGRAFNDLLSRLHVAYDRQRRFGGDASHQLRTPLTILIGQVEVALRQERTAEEYRRVLRSALGRANQLGQIVEALLFLARAEGEAQLPDCGVLDLAGWADHHAQDHPANHPDVSISRRKIPDAVARISVRAHPPLLAQLLDNLVDNAGKYGRAGRPIVVETAVEGTSAILAVEDEGPGIPPADLPHVFEPFYRSSEARRLGIAGVGLGLAVVHRIATALGGSVVVKSEPGKGCRVVVRLPIVEESNILT